MAEYIDREELIRDIISDMALFMGTPDDVQKHDEQCIRAISYIESATGADVVPVVHGRWEWLGPNRLVADCMCGTCSACKVRSKYIVNTMLCPNCGAKMDIKDGDDNDGESVD